ncbi:phage tail tape measure protein [Clostridium sp. D53t1_180928_C8]|uniref:phage tail tape measure protein n=1 Tax=Clostridium sp. D53t1_180928_C8 TaxID=2787101 RepID=UPI0018AC72FE|nr:phage tail tape measure protein [Clostridium sp. D53t1_180928_C8]
MSVNAGSAVAYLELDYSKYSAGLLTARQQLSTFTDNTQEAGTRVQALGGIVTGIGATLTTGFTVPLVTAGAASLTVAANFEEGMSKVQAISGATAGDMEQLSAKAKELGANTKFSATEASEAFSYMAMAGWKTTDMLNGIDGIMNLAAASGENLALVSDICTDAMTAFGLSADQSARFADVLAAASSNANTNVAMLGESFKYVAPVAGAMGYSVEDTAVALGLMANSGIKASQAGTSLRQILLGLQGGVELATKSTDKWRIEVENSDGSMRNLNDVVVDLRAAFGDMTDAQKASNAEAIAGKIGMSGLLSIVNASEADFNKLTGAIDNSTGVAKKMADTMQNNLKGKITQFKSALEGAGIAIGENLIPALTKGVTKITDMVSAFNNLPPATQKTIVSVGATVAAIGPLMMIGGKLITGIGKTISLVSSLTSLAGSGLVASLGAVAGPLAVVGAGFYAWHEAIDAGNQSIIVSREEMSLMERVMGDLTGVTSYSRTELEEMGLVYKDFNENISKDFQQSVKDMTTDVHDFSLNLNEISLDEVITDIEANELSERVSGALESCIKAIDEKNAELQSGLSNAFNTDGVIDEAEASLLEYWSTRGTKEREEAQKLQDEINTIINNARAEGRALQPQEEEAIRNYYAQIKQLELEALASNQYEIEYATQEFQNRISTMDAESAQELLGQRFEQYQEQQLATRTNYDTLIAMAQENYSNLSEEEKLQVDATVARLEAARDEELRIAKEKYDANVDYAIECNEELADVFNRYTGEMVKKKDFANYQEYELMRKHYEGIEQITESGYKRVYDTATGTWKDLYVSVDSTTGQLKGVYDLNTQNVAAMTRDDESALRDEVAAWNETAAGVLSNCLIMGDAYIDAQGNISNSSGEIIGKLGEVVDANGEVVDAILDVNGNPIRIGDNTDEVIRRLKNTREEVKSTDGKKANINVTDNGTANQVKNNIANIPSYKQVTVGVVGGKWNGSTMYATGTDNAMPGIASVAEYGPELIIGRTGEVSLATGRQLMSFEGGETVYNARQTQEILSSMNSTSIQEKGTNKLLQNMIVKLDELKKSIDKKNFNNVINNNFGGVEVNGVTDVRELIEELTEYTELREL